MSMRTPTAFALVTALGAALSIAAPAHAGEGADKEKCYGVAMAGKNDCGGKGNSCAGSSKKDHDGMAWKYVPKGTCVTLKSKTSPTGYGQLKEFDGKAMDKKS
jgi:uncharacterized membrane protein